ncbi:unnamed protein product [Caenorhabditis nigoni]
MAQTKTIGEQMAALNTSDDTSFADRSNSLLNATCPARIQNNSSGNLSFAAPADTSMTSSIGKWRPKREPLKITPLEQIDENPPARKYVPATTSSKDKRPSEYKTRLCDAYRRSGWCPYNNNCTYAHGDKELQIPKRRVPSEYTTSSSLSTSSKHHREYHRDSRDSRDNYRRHSRERRNSSKRDDFDVSFRGGAGSTSSSSRYRSNDDSSRYGNDRCGSSSSNNHYNSNNSHHHSHRPICHAFQRGNCRYGPRCRYLHQEQLPQFNGNATMYACPPSDSIYYHSHQNTHTYLMPYFIPQQAPPPPHQQYVDLNQSIVQPIQYLPPPQAPPTYFVPPPQQVPLDQSIVYAPPTDQVYSQPPPPLMS